MAISVRDDIGLPALIAFAVAFTFTLVWMLGTKGARKGLLQSLGRNHDTVPPYLSTTHRPLAWRGYSRTAMFHKAVAQHDASVPKQKALPHQAFISSSPSRPNFQLGNSILKTTPSSTLNAPFKKQVPSLSGHGVKRTSSGIEKTLSSYSAFEEAPTHGSQAKPIVLDGTVLDERLPASTRIPEAPESAFFDADDFESDLDLEVEEPVARHKIPSSAAKKAHARVAQQFYPTLPRQQSLNTARGPSPSDSGYHSLASNKYEPPPPPSSALPWSSSPPEHAQPSGSQNRFQQFSYPSGPSTVKPSATINTPSTAASAVKSNSAIADKPVKRRTLPWKRQDQEAQAEQNGPPLPRVNQTPASKSSGLWNSTASAVKDQQKALREVNKKKSKFNEAQEKAMEIIQRQQSKKAQVARVFLSDEQQHILDLVSEQKMSVFFTGSAGTGKSVLLREIISTLRKKHLREPDRVAVTASTGLAACNIGGVTLHSFAGIGLGKEDIPELVKRIRRNQKAKQRWMRTKILVIDEVSMVDGDLFDKLEAIARQIRNNGRPFGGIQLVITGDFFQLPPVPDSKKTAKFAFDAASWTTSIHHTIGLHQVFRQKDPVFAGMLNEMREGKLSQSSINAFHKLNRPLDNGPMNTMATELFPTRNEVEAANTTRMNQLVGDVKTYEARDGGAIADKVQRDRLLQNCMAPENIHLKKGAQVMLIKNIDESLVNGSIGTVMGFMSEQTFDRYTDNEAEFISTQGDLRDGNNPMDARFKKAAARITDNMLGSTSMLYPVVRFTLADNTTRDLLCQRETWKIELPNGEVQASRSQIPLILAWALSIHKAQGQTLERVKVDLGKVFENGQAYVALSRATSMAGLQVLRFDAKKVFAHEKVRTFYSNLSRVEGIDGKKKRKTAAQHDFE